MLTFFTDAVTIPMAGGLSGLWNTIKSNWLAPLYLAAIAVFAFVFLRDRAWMKLISFIGIAAIVGVFVFAGADWFGEGGNLQRVGNELGSQIN